MPTTSAKSRIAGVTALAVACLTLLACDQNVTTQENGESPPPEKSEVYGSPDAPPPSNDTPSAPQESTQANPDGTAGKPESDASRQPVDPSRYKDIFGPQFYPYELDEYRISHNRTCPFSMTGRHVAVQYRLKPDVEVSREVIAKRIADALIRDGWEQTALPSYAPLTVIPGSVSPHDLYFTRGPFAPDDDIHTYNQRIFISDDGRGIVTYWEGYWS